MKKWRISQDFLQLGQVGSHLSPMLTFVFVAYIPNSDNTIDVQVVFHVFCQAFYFYTINFYFTLYFSY